MKNLHKQLLCSKKNDKFILNDRYECVMLDDHPFSTWEINENCKCTKSSTTHVEIVENGIKCFGSLVVSQHSDLIESSKYATMLFLKDGNERIVTSMTIVNIGKTK